MRDGDRGEHGDRQSPGSAAASRASSQATGPGRPGRPTTPGRLPPARGRGCFGGLPRRRPGNQIDLVRLDQPGHRQQHGGQEDDQEDTARDRQERERNPADGDRHGDAADDVGRRGERRVDGGVRVTLGLDPQPVVAGHDPGDAVGEDALESRAGPQADDVAHGDRSGPDRIDDHGRAQGECRLHRATADDERRPAGQRYEATEDHPEQRPPGSARPAAQSQTRRRVANRRDGEGHARRLGPGEASGRQAVGRGPPARADRGRGVQPVITGCWPSARPGS